MKRSFRSIEWHFLLSLLSGIIIAFVLLAQIIERLLENHPTSIAGLFFGLVAASVIVAGFMVDTWNPSRVVLGVATGIAVCSSWSSCRPSSRASLLVFFFGAIAISAMILPEYQGHFFIDDWYVWVVDRSRE